MFSKLEARLVNKESIVSCLFVDRLFSNSRLRHHLVFKSVEMQARSERGEKGVQIVLVLLFFEIHSWLFLVVVERDCHRGRF